MHPHKGFLILAGIGLLLSILACVTLGSRAESSPSPTPAATVQSQTAAPPTTQVVPPPAPTTAPTPTPTLTSTPLPTTGDATTPFTVTPTLTPTAYLPTVMQNWALSVWETQLTLNSYGWEQALRPSTPDKPYYPYPDLDFGAVGPLTPHTYTGIILENSYIRITVLPELGGRILRWEDRITGHLLTYANPVVKPTHWGYRGWWLGTGGIEWAFPVDEHGLNEYRPWQYELLSGDNWRGVRVWDTDDRTGMTIEVTLRLYGGRSDLVITPRIANPTGESQPLQFWINAMLTLSGSNAPSSGLRFWIPADAMMVHSTNDGLLPGPRSAISWPVYNGRDFSHYTEWRKYLGLFAAEARGAAGAYDETADQGLVRSYPPGGPQGVKLFCLGDLPAYLYTDDGSRYFEFWGGYNYSFFPEDYVTLPAGDSITWEEHWYPVHGIGGLGWANGELAASLKVAGESVQVGLYATGHAEALLRLLQNGELQEEWAVVTGPDTPFRQSIAGSGGGWLLQVWQGGTLLAEVSPS